MSYLVTIIIIGCYVSIFIDYIIVPEWKCFILTFVHLHILYIFRMRKCVWERMMRSPAIDEWFWSHVLKISTIQTLTFDTRLKYTAMSKQTAVHECKNRIFDDTDPQINKKRMRVEERADLASAETISSSNTELNSDFCDSKMAVDTNSDLPLKSNPKIVSIGHYSLDLLCDFKKVP